MFGFSVIRSTVMVGVVVSSLALAGCKGDGSTIPAAAPDATPAASTPATGGGSTVASASSTSSASPSATSTSASTTTVQAMSLSGKAASSVTVGSAFNFTPTLVGASGTVGFSIQNKPAWATFNVATGALSGTPTAASVGTYANILISAADGAGGKATLAVFSVTVVQAVTTTGTATLSWTRPMLNTDGSNLMNLAGYRIYYGASEGAMSNSINVTNPALSSYTVANLGSGTYYFGMTAYTSDGLESAMSNVGSKTIM